MALVAVLFGMRAESALAFVSEGVLGAVRYRVMAPDWVCRGEAVSFLVVVSTPPTHDAEARRHLVATLVPPAAGFEAGPDAALERRVDLTGGEEKRFAFTDWRVPVDAPLGEFAFGLALARPGVADSVSLVIPVTTIRGAAVPRGIWSILVPAAISLLALPVFVLFIRRYARPGAWKQAMDLDIQPSEDAWWKSDR